MISVNLAKKNSIHTVILIDWTDIFVAFVKPLLSVLVTLLKEGNYLRTSNQTTSALHVKPKLMKIHNDKN